MDSTPSLVSVIIPTYNRAYCIEKTIRSALDQTHQLVEICVADDGSSDGTRTLLEKLQAEDGRVKYRYQANQGVGAARNTALSMATGEFVAFLDSDDLWHPWKLELQVRALRHQPELGMVWTDMAAIDPEGKVVAERYLRRMYTAYQWFPGDTLFTRRLEAADWLADAKGMPPAPLLSGDIYSAMVMGNLVHTSTVMLRRAWAQQLGGFPVDRPIGEDYDYHLRTCRLGPVGYLDVASTLYQRGRADRLTRPELRLTLARTFLANVENALTHDADRITLSKEMIRAVRADANRWVGLVHFDQGEFAAAAPYLAESLRQDARQPKLWGKWLLCQPPPWVARSAMSAWRRVTGRGSQAVTTR
jgi:glycosyltransferase involved in cell wall biosynthesis